MEKILITGMSGGLANVVASKLTQQYEIIGVDFRNFRGVWPYSGEFLKVDYTKRALADIFLKYSISKVLHLGRIGNPWENFYKRYNLNVLGTNNILNMCSKYHVKTVLIFSTFHIYGAHQHNPTNIDEEYPLRAAQIFPQLADAIELDHLATTYLWKNRDARTIVLRPCNIVGPSIKNTISQFLRSKYVPYLMGFNPMLQFIHEQDIARAIVLAIAKENVLGIYNVAGPGTVPLLTAIKLADGVGIPIPHFLAYTMANNLENINNFPSHLMDYFRYPVVINDQKFREATDFKPSIDMKETLRYIR